MSELTTLFQNTADAIRSKTGDTAAMQASQFPAKIQGISVGISQDEADARYLQLAGGTMTGMLTLSGAPTSDLQAATKKYVDDKAGSSEETIIDWSNENKATGTAFCTPEQFLGKRFLVIYADFSEAVSSTVARAQLGDVGFVLTSNNISWMHQNVLSCVVPLQIRDNGVYGVAYNSTNVQTQRLFIIAENGLTLAQTFDVYGGAKMKLCLM